MTGKGPRKAMDGGHAPARLLQAREFHGSARSLVTLGQRKSYNAAVTLMITAAIAYSDAITARARGVVNQQDHQSPRDPDRQAGSPNRHLPQLRTQAFVVPALVAAAPEYDIVLMQGLSSFMSED